MMRQLLADQSDGPLSNLRTKSMCSGFRHDSKFSQSGASCNPGAVQCITAWRAPGQATMPDSTHEDLTCVMCFLRYPAISDIMTAVFPSMTGASNASGMMSRMFAASCRPKYLI